MRDSVGISYGANLLSYPAMAFPFVQVNREGWQGMGQDKLWNGAKSLYEMPELEDELKPFVNDFKLNLFDYHEWKEFSRFKTANRLLFEALSCGSDRRRMKKIYEKIPNIKFWIWKVPKQLKECWE